MPKLIWIGRSEDVASLQPLLNAHGLIVALVPSVDAAIEAATSGNAAAVVVSLDWSALVSTVERLRVARPEMQVLMATRLGVPMHVSAALEAGVVDLLDLKAQNPEHTIGAIEHALSRHKRAVRERDLLLALRALNEEFLRGMVLLDKRNLELEQQILGESPAAADPQAGTRILVIDDEPAIAELVQLILQEHGYEVVTAADGESAMERFARERFHIVITDKNLPRMDGHAILREVKRLRPETDVIIITGYSSKESVMEALHAGASAYLEKPFNDIDEVARKVDGVVAAQRDRMKKREYLWAFKQRNREFLEQYRKIRAELEAWLAG